MTKLLFITLLLLSTSHAQEILKSWNDSTSKKNIIEYVQTVTNTESENFIPVQDRIAVFDNDGTLWSEKPAYFQLYFAIDRVKALAHKNEEWKITQPFQAAIENDMVSLMKSGEEGLLKLVLATHSGMSNEEFEALVTEWINTAEHPTLKRPFKELVYQPMLELLEYLRANQFKTFIVSGGGIDFMRPFVSEIYGMPSEQVIGSTVVVEYKDKKIMRLPKLNTINDKAGKPQGIHYHVGKHPVAAFGNSDGDFAMMEYTEANQKYKTFQLYVHHTDATREFSYDRKSHVGKLDKGLDYAHQNNWTVVDMKKDWRVVYPYQLGK